MIICFKTYHLIYFELGLGWTFWIFSIGSVVGIIFTFFVIPETKGKSMAEIQAMLNGTTNKTEIEENKY